MFIPAVSAHLSFVMSISFVSTHGATFLIALLIPLTTDLSICIVSYSSICSASQSEFVVLKYHICRYKFSLPGWPLRCSFCDFSLSKASNISGLQYIPSPLPFPTCSSRKMKFLKNHHHSRNPQKFTS